MQTELPQGPAVAPRVPVCLTAQGARFGTRFPTLGYDQYGNSHDCVCEYGDTACWDVTYPTKEVMNRCVPCEDPTQPDCQAPLTQSTKCVDAVQGLPVVLDEAAQTNGNGPVFSALGAGERRGRAHPRAPSVCSCAGRRSSSSRRRSA